MLQFPPFQDGWSFHHMQTRAARRWKIIHLSNNWILKPKWIRLTNQWLSISSGASFVNQLSTLLYYLEILDKAIWNMSTPLPWLRKSSVWAQPRMTPQDDCWPFLEYPKLDFPWFLFLSPTVLLGSASPLVTRKIRCEIPFGASWVTCADSSQSHLLLLSNVPSVSCVEALLKAI